MIQPSEGLQLKFADGRIEKIYRFTDNAIYCRKDSIVDTILSMYEWKMNFKDPSKIKNTFEILEEISDDS